MATNVLSRSVFSGGGANLELYSYVLQTDSGDEALLRFIDAEEITLTATADDIRRGKTAITEDGVVEGTFEGVDTSDANAVADDILLGKTAYVNGEKVTGTKEEISLPTLTNPATEAQIVSGYEALDGNGALLTGTAEIIDTTDADATAGDIRANKTAYVNGVKVTGTWVPALVTKTASRSYAPGTGKIAAGGTYDVTFNFGDVSITGTPTGSTSGTYVVFNSVVSVSGGIVVLQFKNTSTLAIGIKNVTFYCTASYTAIE